MCILGYNYLFISVNVFAWSLSSAHDDYLCHRAFIYDVIWCKARNTMVIGASQRRLSVRSQYVAEVGALQLQANAGNLVAAPTDV